MALRRRKNRTSPTGEATAEPGDEATPAALPESETADPEQPDELEYDRSQGPFDAAEVDEGQYVDLGALRIPPMENMEIRVEVDQQTQEPGAVTLVMPDGAVQVRPYAAPTRDSLWDRARSDIRADINSNGGMLDEGEGTFGVEVHARMPVEDDDGNKHVQAVRFVGVDGPRWMLQGVFLGAGADPSASAALDAAFRALVVNRTAGPMAPATPLPIVLPQDAAESEDE